MTTNLMPQLHPPSFVAVTTDEAVFIGLLFLLVLAHLLKLLLSQVAQVALVRRALDHRLGR